MYVFVITMYFRSETQVHGAVCIYWVFFQRTLIGMGFSTFDDAHAFLMEAKGLPSIPSASTRLRLCVRTCILLSWVALEDGLDCQIDAWGARGRTIKGLPIKLKLRMLAFLLPLSEPALLNAEFDRLHKIRGQLVHPRIKESSPHLALKDADQTFQYCLRLLRAIHTCGAPTSRSSEANRRSMPAITIIREPQKMPPVRERPQPALGRKSAAK